MSSLEAPQRREKSRATVATGLALLGIVALFLVGLGQASLFEPDEGRYAEIPREMLASGDWVTPRLNGVLYFEKPPLYYWLNAVAIAGWGLDETACRLWSALLGLGGVGLAFVLGRSLKSPAAGLLAAAILATSPLYAAMARINSIDMTLSFLIGATLTCFWLAHRLPRGRKRDLLWRTGAACAALAVLAKGLVGLVLPGGVVFFYLLVTRGWSVVARVPWKSALSVFFLLAIPWHVVMASRHPDFLWFYFVREHFLRYATDDAARWQPVWFFPPVVLVGFLPWSGLLAGTVPLVRNRDPASDQERRGVVFLALWAAVIVVFFSLSRSKLIPYVLPAFLPLAVLAALTVSSFSTLLRSRFLRWSLAVGGLLLASLGGAVGWISLGHAPELLPAGVLPRLVPMLAGLVVVGGSVAGIAGWLRRRTLFVTAGLAAALAFHVCVLAAAPTVTRLRTTRELAGFLRQHLAAEDDVASFDTYPQTLPVYLERRIDVVGYRGELTFGIAKLGPAERRRWYPTFEEFPSRWRGPQRIFLVIEDGSLDLLARSGVDPGPVLFREGPYLVFCNQPIAG